MIGQEKYPVYISILLVFAVTPLCIAEVSSSTGLILAAEGKLDYQIVVPPEYLEFGKTNVLVVRVHNSEANGGI